MSIARNLQQSREEAQIHHDEAPPAKSARTNIAYQVLVIQHRVNPNGEDLITDVALVGAKRGSELKFSDLSPADKIKCREAMAK